MSKTAAAFVAKLSEDPDLRSRFKEDPDAVMNEHGKDLTEEDKKVLRTQDGDAIKGYLGDDGPPGCLCDFTP